MSDRIYFDYNATTPLHPDIALPDVWANSSAAYFEAKSSEQCIDHAKRIISEFINCRADQLVFTSGGTESINTVLMQPLFLRLSSSKPRKLVVSAIEHPAVTMTVDRLSSFGLEVVTVPVDSRGFLDIDALRAAVDSGPALVSLILAHNELGTIQNWKTIGSICKQAGALLHYDAVQAFGKIPLDMEALQADFLSFSAHKIYGPKGIGGLYCRNPSGFSPLITGGGHQNNLRSGTINASGIAGFGQAVQFRGKEMADEFLRLKQYKDSLINDLKSVCSGLTFNGDTINSLANTISITIPEVNADHIVTAFDAHGISISAGSACSGNRYEPSRSLLAIGHSVKQAKSTIRISLGRNTTSQDIQTLIKTFKTILSFIR